MAIPGNRQEFIERVLQNLGSPVIKINVTPEQIENRIDQALYEFYQRHFHSLETGWYIITPSKTDVANGFMVLPSSIVGVGELYRINTDSNIYSVDFQLKLAELWGLSSITFSGSLSYYYTVKMHLGLLKELFMPDYSYDFNYLTKKIVIYGLSEIEASEGSMILKVFRQVEAADGDVTDTGAITANIWQSQWLIDYSTALTKLQWAGNMGKYQNIQLLGGITLNSAEMKAEAKEEIAELKQQLISEYQLPPIGWCG